MGEITLRLYDLSDVDHFMGWACDPKVLEFSGIRMGDGGVTHKSSRHDVETYLSQMVIPHPWYRAICLNYQPVGFISVEPQGTGFDRGRAVISAALGRKYWSGGIATIATKMAVSAAFKDLPELVRIEAFVDPNNKASGRVLEKTGFLREGLLRKYSIVDDEPLDYFIYSILSTDKICGNSRL